MNNYPHGVSSDDPNLELYEWVHAIDHEMSSTRIAISIHRAAVADGHPGGPGASRKAMTGPPAATAVQATMNPFLEEAIGFDEIAEQYVEEALDSAREARDHADSRARLPHERVTLSDGSSQTRGQVHDGHGHRMKAAAQRVTRGDHEHRALHPGLGTRITVTTVLATIETFLLIWPVTNASWTDPKSVAYVAGLIVMFLFMNEQLPRLAGLAWREHRETREAVHELTAVGVTAGRSGDLTRGREILGHVDSRHLKATWRSTVWITALFGTVLTVYAAVMFTRVLRLAQYMGSPLFSALAAALITVFTAGVPVVMALRWSRGNALGDELREHGAITTDSCQQAEHQHELALAAIGASEHLAELAGLQLDQATQKIADGSRVVAVGLQKAALILGLDSVPSPDPANLFPSERAIRERAISNLNRAAAIRAEVRQALAEPGPFEPGGPVLNPWEHRTAPRRAQPDPTHLDPAQVGPLHRAEIRTPWFRSPYIFFAAVIALAIAIVVTILIL